MTPTNYPMRRAIELRENFRSEGYTPFERHFDSNGILHISLSHPNRNLIEIEVNQQGAAIYKNKRLIKIEIFKI